MSSAQVLKSLMWKHLLVRKRRICMTIFEFLGPMGAFIFVTLTILFLKYIENLPIPDAKLNEENINRRRTFDRKELERSLILYTPDTPLTNSLMNEVGRRVNLSKLNEFPNKNSFGYFALTQTCAPQIEDLIRKLKDNTVVIKFQNMGAVHGKYSYPQKLNYTILKNIEYLTDECQLRYTDNGLNESVGTGYQPFLLHLQWAIDASYIQLTTNHNEQRTLQLEERPLNKDNKTLYNMMYMILLQAASDYSTFLPFISLCTTLVEERVVGVKEMLMISGVSNNMLVLSHLLNIVPVGIAYSIVGTVTTHMILSYNSAIWMLFHLITNFITTMSLAYLCSNLTNDVQSATVLSALAFLILKEPSVLFQSIEIPKSVQVLLGIFPWIPSTWFFENLFGMELAGKAIDFNYVFKANSISQPLILAFIFSCLQTILFYLLAWYIGQIFVGPVGVAKPWNFLFMKSYWKKAEMTPASRSLSIEKDDFKPNQAYFEPVTANSEAGIKIENVTKIFGDHRAVSNVTFDVLKGEIMILLGHNGAGKTTLMSMITGLTSLTAGKITVMGHDISTHMPVARKYMGLCTQHNVFIQRLTIKEHVLFFSMIRGQTKKEAEENTNNLLKRLHIEDKANDQSEQLSGGMKRRLQLACALAGNTKVLILDEPTSGLDVETRRELWDLLLALRGEHTVLLTTHHMEEADALGDRIAAMHGGHLQCYATPMFLKKVIGTGYRLSLTTTGAPQEEAITTFIKSVIPDAQPMEKTYNSISFMLPMSESSKFSDLFSKLEGKRSELQIQSIGVGVTTLEEVFLKVCSDVADFNLKDDQEFTMIQSNYPKLSGVPLLCHRIKILISRQFKYLKDHKISLILLQCVIPLALIIAITISSNQDPITFEATALSNMNLDLYEDMMNKKVLLNLYNRRVIGTLSDTFKSVQFDETGDKLDAILRSRHEEDGRYEPYLLAIELNETNAKVRFTTTVRHAASVAVNLLSNIIATELIPQADGKTIVTYNTPLDSTYVALQQANLKKVNREEDQIQMWAILLGSIFVLTIGNAGSLPIYERVSGSRHIHIMMGCSPFLHWNVAFLVAFFMFLLVQIVPTVLITYLADRFEMFTQTNALVALFLTMTLSLSSFLALTFLLTFKLDVRSLGTVTSIVLFIGIITAWMDLNLPKLNNNISPRLLSICGYVLPSHTIILSLLKTSLACRINAYCNINKDNCPNIIAGTYDGFDVQRCCVDKTDPISYYEFTKYSPLSHLIALIVQFVIFMILVYLSQYGVFDSLCGKVKNKSYKPKPPKYHDATVLEEQGYVKNAINLPASQIQDGILIDDVHKIYPQCGHKDKIAVKGVSFSVKKGTTSSSISSASYYRSKGYHGIMFATVHRGWFEGLLLPWGSPKSSSVLRQAEKKNYVDIDRECFGLLGVNGAGKSTMFKMISSEVIATRGRIFSNGYFLKWPREKYLHTLGYCPQFFGLDEFLTGRENLTLLLTMRGHSYRDIATQVEAWIVVVGLEKYKDKKVSGYSGGCKRRIAAAAALAGSTAMTLLDEPTAGVDVAARRRVWMAMRVSLKRGNSIIVTSHSMDEMEALCNRVSIMAGGELAALGSAAALRAKYAKGHTVIIRLKSSATPDEGEEESRKQMLLTLNEEIAKQFKCTLKDEHKTTLHYQIIETVNYSDLFAALEQLKSQFPNLIEDYSASETTLEEVLLSFAEKKKIPVKKPAPKAKQTSPQPKQNKENTKKK